MTIFDDDYFWRQCLPFIIDKLTFDQLPSLLMVNRTWYDVIWYNCSLFLPISLPSDSKSMFKNLIIQKNVKLLRECVRWFTQRKITLLADDVEYLFRLSVKETHVATIIVMIDLLQNLDKGMVINYFHYIDWEYLFIRIIKTELDDNINKMILDDFGLIKNNFFLYTLVTYPELFIQLLLRYNLETQIFTGSNPIIINILRKGNKEMFNHILLLYPSYKINDYYLQLLPDVVQYGQIEIVELILDLAELDNLTPEISNKCIERINSIIYRFNNNHHWSDQLIEEYYSSNTWKVTYKGKTINFVTGSELILKKLIKVLSIDN